MSEVVRYVPHHLIEHYESLGWVIVVPAEEMGHHGAHAVLMRDNGGRSGCPRFRGVVILAMSGKATQRCSQRRQIVVWPGMAGISGLAGAGGRAVQA